MTDRTEKNIRIFMDTCSLINKSVSLREAVADSVKKQKLFLADADNDFSVINKRRDSACNVVVSEKRTLEAAAGYVRAGRKTAVLNFASATNPGGGVINGASSQEEALCRCSTLYPCLNTDMMRHDFYMPHRDAHDSFHNNDILYTPDVVVIKSDTDFPEELPETDRYRVDVITCAAPNLRYIQLNASEPDSEDMTAYTEIMRDRIRQIFRVTLTSGAEVLILGAFGCGAFRNPPETVAKLFREAAEEYGHMFDTIEFAVFHTKKETANYNAFRKEFEKEDEYNIGRFISAQKEDFETALAEIRAGRKRSHWMWYVFPQIAGLGHSPAAEYYAIRNIREAELYISDNFLSVNMQKICEALLECKSSDPYDVMGYPDNLKLRSSMTLFAEADADNPVYQRVLDKFYGGQKDSKTLEIIAELNSR